MYYCHTKSRYTIELFLSILVVAISWAGCITRPVDFGSGLMGYDSRKYDEAMLVFQEIADKDGEEASRARFYMGESYKYQSKYDRAIEQFQMVADAEPARSYLAKQARDCRKQLRKSVDSLQESLDYLRICIKYQLFDLEATHRENEYLRKLLEEKDS